MVVILTVETGDEFAAPAERWADVLALAARYGWTPRGSVRPGGWDGDYLRPCGQMIASADARALAAALQQALDDVPDHAAPPCRDARRPRQAFETFSGPRKRDLAALAEFLRGGACTVFGACDAHRGDLRLD